MKKIVVASLCALLSCFNTYGCSVSDDVTKITNQEWRNSMLRCEPFCSYKTELVTPVKEHLFQQIKDDEVAERLLGLFFNYQPLDFIVVFKEKYDSIKTENKEKFLELLEWFKFALTPGGYWVGTIIDIVQDKPFYRDNTKYQFPEFCCDAFLCLAHDAALAGELEISQECSRKLYSFLRDTSLNLKKYEKMKMDLNPHLMHINEIAFIGKEKSGSLGDIDQVYNEHFVKITDPHARTFVETFVDGRIEDCVGLAETFLQKRDNEDSEKCMELLSIVAGRYQDFDDEITERIVTMYNEEEVTLKKLKYKEFCAAALAMAAYKDIREKSNEIYDPRSIGEAKFFAEMADMIYESIPGKSFENRSLAWVYDGTIKEWDESPSSVWPNWKK
ncbi:MAG: hypothetical protein LBB25_02545 [Holosporaceae bacterium]|jgi:hypothetical protein|nr:hypothetical protein [Holosporaceae bacterium]